MNKVDEALNQLTDELNSCPEIQEYLRLKELIESDKELKEMILKIARLTSENKKEERDNLIKIYESHPLVTNYYIMKEEVKSLLAEIKDILSD